MLEELRMAYPAEDFGGNAAASESDDDGFIDGFGNQEGWGNDGFEDDDI